MFCHSWCLVRPYETKIVKEFQTAPTEHIRKFWSNESSWPQKLRNKYCQLYALSFATMIFYGLSAKPQPNREKYGWTRQQRGKRTHKSKQLTHGMMFKLLSKGIVAKKTYQKVWAHVQLFGVSKRTVARCIDRVRDQLCTDFVPLHYGFGPEHMVSCADGMKPFTKELVFFRALIVDVTSNCGYILE